MLNGHDGWIIIIRFIDKREAFILSLHKKTVASGREICGVFWYHINITQTTYLILDLNDCVRILVWFFFVGKDRRSVYVKPLKIFSVS